MFLKIEKKNEEIIELVVEVTFENKFVITYIS